MKLLIIIGGCMLAFFGWEEFQVSRNASAEPARVEIADIEKGSADLSNVHVIIGPHVADFYECIYEYEPADESSDEISDSDKVNYSYYPIYSLDHPYRKELQAFWRKYPDGPPAGVALPEMSNIAVLVKTRDYKTVGAIPEDMKDADSVQGMFVNKIDKLNDEEIELLAQSFTIDPETILLLEMGRTPSGMGKSFGMMGGGGLLVLLGLGWMIGGRRRSS